jgi:hypothetical protein
MAANDAYPVETNGVEVASVEIVWRAVAGTTYSIAVDAGAGGAFYQLSLENALPPVNDAFANRLPLSGSFVTVSGDNALATGEPGEPPVFGIPGFPQFSINASNTLWWSWTAPASGRLQIIHLSDDTTAYVSMFTGNTLASLVRLFDLYQGTELSNVVKGVTYAISADASQDAGGHFTFLLAMESLTLELVSPSTNDPGSIYLRGLPYTPVIVQFSPNLQDWYFWSSDTVSASGLLRVSLEPPMYQDPSYDPEIYGQVLISIPPASHRFFRAVVR